MHARIAADKLVVVQPCAKELPLYAQSRRELSWLASNHRVLQNMQALSLAFCHIKYQAGHLAAPHVIVSQSTSGTIDQERLSPRCVLSSQPILAHHCTEENVTGMRCCRLPNLPQM